jgi:peptide/nickel transport system permease protein
VLQLIGRRLLLLVPTLLLVTFGVFSLVVVVPGDAATYLAGGESATPERIAEVRDELGLDDPLFVQYGRWLGDAVRLDFGESLFTNEKVTAEISHRLPVTLSIALGSLVIGLVFGVVIGLWAGARHGGLTDRVLLAVTSVGLSIPNFVLAVLLVNYLAIQMGWFDAVGFTRLTEGGHLQLTGWLRSLALPSAALGVGVAARLARQVRAGVVDTLGEPYIRTAWAKGCPPVTVIAKHVFKNAAIPTVTVAGLLIGGLLGGTVLVETIFAAPGIGEYLVRAITNKDLPVIQGVAVMFTLTFVAVNLLVDLLYGWLNPKVDVR